MSDEMIVLPEVWGKPVNSPTQHTIRVELSDKQRIDRSLKQQECFEEIKELEREISEEKSLYKKKIESIQVEIQDLSKIIKDGSEQQAVESSWEKDFGTGYLHLVRHDDMTVIKSRKMTQEEAQVDAFSAPEIEEESEEDEVYEDGESDINQY